MFENLGLCITIDFSNQMINNILIFFLLSLMPRSILSGMYTCPVKNDLPLISGNQNPISISPFAWDSESISNLKNKLMALSNLKNEFFPISKIKKGSISHISIFITISNLKNNICPISNHKIGMYTPLYVIFLFTCIYLLNVFLFSNIKLIVWKIFLKNLSLI